MYIFTTMVHYSKWLVAHCTPIQFDGSQGWSYLVCRAGSFNICGRGKTSIFTIENILLSSCSITLNVYFESVRIKTYKVQSGLTSLTGKISTWAEVWPVCDKTVAFHGQLIAISMAQSSAKKPCESEEGKKKMNVEEECFSSLSKTGTLCQNVVLQHSQVVVQWSVQFSSLAPTLHINWGLSLSFLLF